jgi:hypothetical protein
MQPVLVIIIIIGLLYIAGWLLSLPILLIPKNQHNWPRWIILMAGTAIGPITILLLGFVIKNMHPVKHHVDLANYQLSLYAASIVSFITTVLYLLLTRLAERRKQLA